MGLSDTVDAQRANRRLIRESMNAPLLTRQHELDLARRWRYQNDERALHELIQSYMRLVISTASRFKNYGLPLGDLVQEGVVGLMQAAARFEPERDVRFSTYAAWWIRSAMQDFILRNWSVVRTGTTAAQKSLFFNLRRLRAKIDDGRYGSLDDAGKAYIAQELSVDGGRGRGDGDAPDGRRPVAQRHHQPDRRGRLAGLSGRRAAEPGGDRHRRPRQQAALALAGRRRWPSSASASRRSSASAACARTGARSRSSGVRLGISKERVRQIEHRALQKLKAALVKRVSRTRSSSTCSPRCRPDRPVWTARPARGTKQAMTEATRVDVLIVGGGHAGLLLGAALAQAGFAVRLVERQPRAAIARRRRSDGRTLALLAGSVAIVRRLGAWPSLGASCRPRSSGSRWSTSTGGGHVHYDSDAHGKGPFGVGVEHVEPAAGPCCEAFLGHAGEAACSPGRGRRPAARRRRHARSTLADGSRCRPRSGRRRGRARLAGARAGRIGVDRWAYDQQALTMVLRHERPHRRHRARVAAARRAAGDAAAAGPRTGRHLGRARGRGDELAALPRRDLLAAFDRGHRRGAGRLEIESGPTVYPLGRAACAAATWRRGWRWSATRRTACTRSTPRASTWAWPTSARWSIALVAARARGLDLGSGEALLPYARARRGDNTQRLWLTDGLVRLFTADLGPAAGGAQPGARRHRARAAAEAAGGPARHADRLSAPLGLTAAAGHAH